MQLQCPELSHKQEERLKQATFHPNWPAISKETLFESQSSVMVGMLDLDQEDERFRSSLSHEAYWVILGYSLYFILTYFIGGCYDKRKEKNHVHCS